MKKIMLIMFFALSLVGCAGGPDSSDIQVALKGMMIKEVEFALEKSERASFLRVMGLKPTKEDIKSLEVNVVSVDNTEETEDGSYSAIVSVSATIGYGDEKKYGTPITLQVVMHEAEAGWTLKRARYARDKQNK